MTKQYINLHNHTHGSLLDGISKPEQYAERAKELGQPAIVATDHGNLRTLLDMKDAADESGIKFMPGQEFYQARKTRFDRDPDERAGRARSEWDQRGPYHLSVIAYNDIGYKNLIKLSSRAFTEGFFVKPRIDHDLLSEHAEGLVVLSGCLSGEVQQAILRDDLEYALETAAKVQDIVGKDNYFIEIMNHGIAKEIECHTALVEISKKIGAPIVATCDSHYTHKHQADLHDTSLCISTGAKKAETERFKFGDDDGNRLDEFYLKSYEEMAELFPEEYLDNTLKIYDKFDLDISHGEFHFPVLEMPSGVTTEEYFINSVNEGARRRFGNDWRKDTAVVSRLEYELNIIRQLGFENYFLVVADIVNWARANEILVGPARGSVGGSLLAFCLFITQINPIKYDLAFERFLVYKSPEYDPRFPVLEGV